MTGIIKITAITGYVIRNIVAYLQSYVKWILPGFVAQDDQSKFYSIAIKYYQGDYSSYSTNLPVLLNQMFHVFGTSEYVIRLLFSFCWFIGLIFLVRVAGKLNDRAHLFLIFLYSFMPWTLYIFTGILRESIKLCFIMISVYYLWRWMCDGLRSNLLYSIISTIPAIWMHSGEVWMIGVVFITYLLWNPKTQMWRNIKLNKYVLIGIIGICLVPTFYNLFVFIFPGKFTGSFSIDSLLGQVVYNTARTGYIPEASQQINTPFEFAFWTIYRIVYLWISPSPRFWNTPADILVFFVDVIPWIIFFIYLYRAIKKNRISKKAKLALTIFVCFSFIYAWGTRNAGTALRHRDHIIGIMVMCGLMRDENSELAQRGLV